MGANESKLFEAVKKNDVEKISKLLQLDPKDLYINCQDKDGNTPLHCAVMSGNVQVVQLLCSNKRVSADVKNKANKTAYDLAVEHGNAEMIRVLVCTVVYLYFLCTVRYHMLHVSYCMM